MIRIGEWVYETAYTFRRFVAFSLYAFIVMVAYWAAYLLRFDFSFPDGYGAVFWKSLLAITRLRLFSRIAETISSLTFGQRLCGSSLM